MTQWDARFEWLMREMLQLEDAESIMPDLDTAAAGLDSLATVELLVALEGAYDVVVPDEFLTVETFATPAALWGVISNLLNSGDPI
ncbi:phosphopantetheine-binding protein [Streptomyces sp. NPDC092903]|uniref:phosphopantetheine-binding protein n=1 Tax=Streptomyces sp. NPDC092903 TaxID=3366017 RepID=UPI00382B7891